MFETWWFTIIIIIILPLGIGLLIREGKTQSFLADTGALGIGNITDIIGLLPRLVQVCRCFLVKLVPMANVISHNYEIGRTQRCDPRFEPVSSTSKPIIIICQTNRLLIPLWWSMLKNLWNVMSEVLVLLKTNAFSILSFSANEKFFLKK